MSLYWLGLFKWQVLMESNITSSVFVVVYVGCWYLKVERRIDLVYGGGSVGLMGLVSQAVHDGGQHVLGYAPP